MRKYSTVRASAKELGGMMQQSSSTVTKFSGRSFGIDDGAVDVGKNFKFIGAADIVAVAGRTVGDDALSVGFFDLVRLEGINHAEFFAHSAYPFVGLDAHGVSLFCGVRIKHWGCCLKTGVICFGQFHFFNHAVFAFHNKRGFRRFARRRTCRVPSLV